jgi:hypothetical protein
MYLNDYSGLDTDQFEVLSTGLDDNESIKRRQNLRRLIEDYRRKNQELLDYIDLEYPNHQQKEILLRILQYEIIGNSSDDFIEQFMKKRI